MSRIAPCLLALFVATWGAAASAQTSVVPTDLQQPGSQPGEVSNLETPNKCDNCHGGYDAAVEPAHNWRGSMMAHATRDPIFWATVAVAERDFTGAGDLCLRCHTPDGWLGGRSTPTDGTGLGNGDVYGVTCDGCHRMTNPDTSEWLGEQFSPFLAHDEGSTPAGYYGSGMYVLSDGNTKLGPYDDAVPNHSFLPSQFHRSAEFCGTCHDVSNPVVGDLAPAHGAQLPLTSGFSGVPGDPVELKAAFNHFPFQYGVVERTFSEHQASAWASMPVADYPSLPADLQAGAVQRAYDAALAASPDANYIDGATRLFTCQSCHMQAVNGPGCNKAGAPVRPDLPLHDMTGGNYWIPEAMDWLDLQDRLVVGGGLSGAELAGLSDGRTRAFQNLEDAASLSVQGNTVKVVNLTGHKLISGFPEGRRMWLRVSWYDAQESLLREDGAYGALTVDIDGQLVAVQTLLDPEDEHTHIWEAHYGMTQEWANRLVGWGWPTDLPLGFDRVTGLVEETLGELASESPGSHEETFHFVLNDTILSDNRIPPYGFRYDDARARNALPVPADQYGAPDPGGVYQYWAEVLLDPPALARTATVELLYQPTSWEYIQFLYLANDGSVASLASTGQDILDAWLATGMAAPHLMASASWNAGWVPPAPDIGVRLQQRDPLVDSAPRTAPTLTPGPPPPPPGNGGAVLTPTDSPGGND